MEYVVDIVAITCTAEQSAIRDADQKKGLKCCDRRAETLLLSQSKRSCPTMTSVWFYLTLSRPKNP
jgi:hypothetical protein